MPIKSIKWTIWRRHGRKTCERWCIPLRCLYERNYLCLSCARAYCCLAWICAIMRFTIVCAKKRLHLLLVMYETTTLCAQILCVLAYCSIQTLYCIFGVLSDNMHLWSAASEPPCMTLSIVTRCWAPKKFRTDLCIVDNFWNKSRSKQQQNKGKRQD